MAGERKPRNKRRRLIGIAGSFVSLAVLTYIAVTLISGQKLSLSWLSGGSSARKPLDVADEYHFDVGRSRVFAELGSSIASAGTLGIQVLDAGGSETLRDSFRMTNPAINTRDGRAIAFDVGGTAVRVFNEREVTTSVETNGAIIAASINRNGWFCVCTQEGGGSKGIVTVYNERGRNVYRVNLATGYVLSAALSPDSRNVAILNLTDEGSRITFYNLSSENVDRIFNLPGRLMIDIRYQQGGDILAISTESVIIASRNNEGREIYGFDGKQLGSYSIRGGIVALHLLDYGVGHRGTLIVLDDSGRILGETETDKEIISISLGDGNLAVLRSDGLVYYNLSLVDIPVSGDIDSIVGTTRVLALTGGMALVAGDHSAILFRTEGSTGT